MSPRDKSRLMAAIEQHAGRQFGHVTREQLFAAGATRGWIRAALSSGWMVRVHAGVYAIGHVPSAGRARAMAAVLAAGDGAALSHASAAALWDVFEWPLIPEVLAPWDRRRPGIVAHRSSTVRRGDIRTRSGIRVTSPSRTICDLEPRLTDAQLVRVVNDLRHAGHLGPTASERLCRRSRRVRALLGDDDGATRSELEELFRAFTRRHRLPMPEINVRLPGTTREVDAFYRDAKLIIEIDSWTFHRDRATFERDRLKDAQALADGYRTVRITDRRLRDSHGDREAARIRAILAA